MTDSGNNHDSLIQVSPAFIPTGTGLLVMFICIYNFRVSYQLWASLLLVLMLINFFSFLGLVGRGLSGGCYYGRIDEAGR